MTHSEHEEDADLVDVFYRKHVRPLGNLFVLYGQAEAALLELITVLVGDERKAHELLNGRSAKERACQLIRASPLTGFDLEELLTGVASFYDDRDERNRLIHDEWFPNIDNAGSPLTRGLTRKNAEEVFGEPTVTSIWSLATRFRNHRDLFSGTAFKLRRDGCLETETVADAAFIIDHAQRLVMVATLCVISFGLARGLSDALQANSGDDDDGWHQAALGFEDGTLKRAVTLTHLLLDRDEQMVSFQTVYHRLKSEPVKLALKQALSARYGEDGIFPPSRDELIAKFLDCYSQIDWSVHGRLTHFRNVGVVHLTIQQLAKRITVAELGAFIAIISQLAGLLQHLCQTETAFRSSMLDEYRKYAEKTVTQGRE
jgi:hypothetical protein